MSTIRALTGQGRVELMVGPDDQLRQEIAHWLDEVPSEGADEYSEGILNEILGTIGNAIEADLADNEADEYDLDHVAATDRLACVSSWASVVSYAVGRVYAPASPWHRRLAGWATSIGAMLQRIVNLLKAPLQAAARALQAVSWSISLNFPWGVSVALTWP